MGKPKAADHILRKTAIDEFLSVCDTTEERLVFILTAFTGLRVSEFVHMRCSWIDVEDGVIRVPRHQPCSCAECIRKRGGVWKAKTDCAERPVPIVPECEGVIYDYFAGNDSIMDTIPNRLKAWRVVKRLGERIGTKSFPHALRASFATLLSSYVPEELVVQQVMGWANLDMARFYIKHAGKTMKKKVISKWGKE
jgi:integrase|tara:strand:+ start:3475 stop:4059 length:585 start_codon:yes stop_codon:yes gene_type:complete